MPVFYGRERPLATQNERDFYHGLLGVTSDKLIFGRDERGPDDELRLQFEAISRFDPEERQIAKAVLDSLIPQHEARRWAPIAARKGE